MFREEIIFFCENPLKCGKLLGGMSITFLNFLNKNVKYLELWGNEKEREEVYLSGLVNKVRPT